MAAADPYRYFRVEAAELLERLARAALDSDKGEPVPGGVAALLRYAHTLKGAARVVKQIAIAERAHAIEDLLTPYRGSAGPLPRDCARALYAELDVISRLTKQLDQAVAKDSPETPAEEATRTLRADVSDVEAVIDGIGDALGALESLKGALKDIEQARRACDVMVQQLAAPRRVDPQRTGALLERALRSSEDVAARLRRIDRSLLEGLENAGRTLLDTHASADRLRLVPVSSIFLLLERAARDAAEELGKRVRFTGSGGDVRLSADVLSAARDALLHVVRNAVAHGIESDRSRAGKPAIGVIELEVSQRGADAVFVCRDDGAGLDLAAARHALAQAGHPVEGLSDDAVIEELSRAGVSTSARVTGIAGRGVGLDVLRETAARMSGRARLESRRGHGFSVELSLPLTVAAFTGAVCECGGRTVSVPLAAVVETRRIARSDLTLSGGATSLRYKDEEVPFAQLEQLLGSGSGSSGGVCSVLIVRGKNGIAALGVDRLLGTRATLLRPLPAAARATPLVAGASLDALGNPELVLDADGVVAAVRAVSAVRAPALSRRRPILVVDDSLTTRMLEQSILESAGYEVELASSGEEGLSKARERPFALFLVDVEMPGIDGFTFIDRARVDPALASVPAVLVSSRSSPEDFARGKAVGARGYIVKDRFDQRELLGLIHELVEA